MGLTEREQDLMWNAEVDDILPVGTLLIRFKGRDDQGQVSGKIIGCEQFARCANDATALLPHPILTYVPTCDRCAKIVS